MNAQRRRITVDRTVLVLATTLGFTLPTMAQTGEAPAPTAGADVPAGVLEFRVLDERGDPIPARLTFVREGETDPNLFPNADAKPDDLAVRKNVVYTLSGAGRITVPAGAYTVYASHGLEWSIDTAPLTFAEDRTVQWTARLVHEVDTTGWISADFHLHTLTYSGHGDSNMPERIISIVAEGVEFAVATDHNHHTDYGPTIDHLHATDALTAVTGNEISVPVGHFNAFPLDPAEAPVDSRLADANELFLRVRAQGNPDGIVPVIQVNHPRWDGIDYYRIAGLDPVTGTSADEDYSADYDTVEVFNENAGWGYHEPFVEGVPTSSNIHSVLRDWFNLLDRGRRHAAVGNSDSHTVHYAFAGYPRNFVRVAHEEPGSIDPVEVARALRRRAVFTTVGPFVEFAVDGVPMGGETIARDGSVDLAIRVQAASWIDCDRVMIVFNGDVIETIDVPDTRGVERLDVIRTLPVDRDGWVAVLVEGDDTLAPIITDHARSTRPIAVVNPVWIDADGDGAWTSPWQEALREVERCATVEEIVDGRGAAAGPGERALLVLAAAERARPYAGALIRRGLADADRRVRLAAARAAERSPDPARLEVLTEHFEAVESDPYLRIALLRAVAAIDRARLGPLLAATIGAADGPLPRRFVEELTDLMPGQFVDDWLVIGYFPSPEAGTVTAGIIGPEADPDHDGVHAGKGGSNVVWVERRAASTGYLDLRDLGDQPDLATNAMVCAQTWLYSPDERDVTITLGTDDGSRVYLNDTVVYENASRRGASPLEHVDTWRLRPGANRVLFKVENGGGGYGLYFRVLDEEVTWSTR